MRRWAEKRFGGLALVGRLFGVSKAVMNVEREIDSAKQKPTPSEADAIEIERLAYPSTWPPSAYRKELQDNRWAHYIVLRDKKIVEDRVAVPAPQEPEKQRRFFPLSLLPGRPAATVQSPSLASIVGFAGLWLANPRPLMMLGTTRGG